MRLFKNYLLLLALLTISSQLDAASTLINEFNVNVSGVADETRNVSGFNGISSAGSYDVYITIGNTESLRIEGDSERIAMIETVVEDGVLKIRTKKNMRNLKTSFNQKTNIYITAKSLKLINLSGSGDIEVKNTIKGENLSTAVSGSGSISIPVDVKNLSASISGSGDIEIRGKAENARISINGSGDFDGNELRTSVASARVSGSGDISIHADKSLEASVAGSGDIRYTGNASVKSSKSGSGRISKG